MNEEKSKYDELAEKAQSVADRIVEEEGKPETEEEAFKIFKRVWNELGFKVKDMRNKNE